MKDFMKNFSNYGEKIYGLCNGTVGYLIPAVEHGRKVERTLIRSAMATNRSRPFAWAAFDMETGMMLYYKHCAAEDYIDAEKYPIGTVLKNEFVSKRTVKEQQQYEVQLWECYKNIRGFVLDDNLSEEQKQLVTEYKKQWNLTVLKDLVTYYKALSPEFFAWVDKNSVCE